MPGARARRCTPTSWACGRCSTTCAAASPRTGSRCARPSRSPGRRSRCAPTPIRRRAWRYVPELDDDAAARRPRGRGRLPRGARRRRARSRCIGFCMGGMYAQGRGDRSLRRAVAFYGMIRAPDDWRGPDDPREPLDTAADVCPTLAIFGGDDPFTPAADIEALRAAWADRPDCEIVVYQDAEHGFVHDPSGPRTAPTTPPTPGAGRSRSCCPTDGVPARASARSSSACAVEDLVAAAALDLEPAEPHEQRRAPCSPARGWRPTSPASSSWVIGRRNSSSPPASSSRRFAVRPVTSRNTASASASSVLRSRRASSRTITQSSVGSRVDARRARPRSRARRRVRVLERPGVGRARAVVEEAELAEQVALVEHRDQRLASVGRPGGDRDAPADDAEQLAGGVALAEEHLVAGDRTDRRLLAGASSSVVGRQRAEELRRLEDASFGHGAASVVRPHAVGERHGAPGAGPTPLVSWLSGRFPDRHRPTGTAPPHPQEQS